jgi:hypothetical protein
MKTVRNSDLKSRNLKGRVFLCVIMSQPRLGLQDIYSVAATKAWIVGDHFTLLMLPLFHLDVTRICWLNRERFTHNTKNCNRLMIST